MSKLCLRRFLSEDTAQDLVEYAFLLAFIALGTFVGINSVGGALLGKLQATSTAIDSGS
jgi:Flp pilus assembly pilin Flp